MDINDLKPVPSEMNVVFPTGEATDMFITVVGQDSKQFQDKQMQNLSATGDQNMQGLHQLGCETLAALIVGWRGYTNKGEPILYTPEAALEFVSKPEHNWIVQQLVAFIGKRANFFRKPGGAA